MGSSFSEKPDYFKIELVHNNNTDVIKDINDVLYALKAYRRKIKYRLEFLEKQNPNTPENDKEIAVLIRQNQYLEVLLNKEKHELEDIFFPNGKSNCIIPDVFLWYKEPES